MKKYLIKARNKVLPVMEFIIAQRELKKRCESDDVLQITGCKNYCALPEGVLKERLEKEHGRGAAIDEKTNRFTSSFTVIFAVLALTTAFFAGQNGGFSGWDTFVFAVFAFYIFTSIYLTVGALMTIQTYGYGTQFELQLHQGQNNSVLLSECLARQEIVNIMRQNRNSTVHASLRNAMVALAALLISLVAEHYELHTWIYEMIFQNG